MEKRYALFPMKVIPLQREELEKMGIDLNRTAKIKKTMPSAFGEQKYCPTPKGWKSQ